MGLPICCSLSCIRSHLRLLGASLVVRMTQRLLPNVNVAKKAIFLLAYSFERSSGALSTAVALAICVGAGPVLAGLEMVPKPNNSGHKSSGPTVVFAENTARFRQSSSEFVRSKAMRSRVYALPNREWYLSTTPIIR